MTLGAEGQGMVAGDLVENTAARIQTAAEPGTVLVGEVTRRTTEQAIAYADAGSHELKGKLEPVPLFRALRVVSGRAGSMRSAGLEAPFVGRDHELKLIKDMFHGAAENGSAHLVSVTGIAGIGESPASRGSSTSTSTGSSRASIGTGGAVSRTGRASRTGRSPTWCGCAVWIVEDEAPVWPGASSRRLEEHMLDDEERELVGRGWRTCWGWRRERR